MGFSFKFSLQEAYNAARKGKFSFDLMQTAQMFNPLAMAEGNLKVIRECMDKGEIISDLVLIITSVLLKITF